MVHATGDPAAAERGRRARTAHWRPLHPGDPGLAAAARAWVRSVLPPLLQRPARPYLHDDVELLLSELTANALEHAGGVERVELHCTDAALRILVHDPAPARPWPTSDRRPDSERGRGTLLFERLAAAWGVHDHPADGKDVWLELAL